MQNEKIIKLVHTDLVCYIHNVISLQKKQCDENNADKKWKYNKIMRKNIRWEWSTG